jgi:hypothetical protein
LLENSLFHCFCRYADIATADGLLAQVTPLMANVDCSTATLEAFNKANAIVQEVEEVVAEG